MDIKTATLNEISRHWSLKESDAIYKYLNGEVEIPDIEDVVATSIFWTFAYYEYKKMAKNSLSDMKRD